MSARSASRSASTFLLRYGHAPEPLAISSNPVQHRLAALAPELGRDGDWQALLGPTRNHLPGAQIVAEGDLPTAPRAVRSGWACMVRQFRDGRRQIQHLLLPGDLLIPPVGMRAPSAVLALTRVSTVQIDAFVGSARAATALQLDAALTQHALLAQVARLGRQTAAERLAHLLLEIRDRLELAGLCDGQRFAMPLTQETIADVVGLTSVHLNRTLQGMRREQLIDWRSGRLQLLDAPRLARMADYRPPRWL